MQLLSHTTISVKKLNAKKFKIKICRCRIKFPLHSCSPTHTLFCAQGNVLILIRDLFTTPLHRLSLDMQRVCNCINSEIIGYKNYTIVRVWEYRQSTNQHNGYSQNHFNFCVFLMNCDKYHRPPQEELYSIIALSTNKKLEIKFVKN